MPGDVGAVATLLNTLALFFTSPTGYAALSREKKLKDLNEGFLIALDQKQWIAVDVILAELKRLHSEEGL